MSSSSTITSVSLYLCYLQFFISDFTIGKHEKFLATSKQRLKSPRGKDVALTKHSRSFKVVSTTALNFACLDNTVHDHKCILLYL